MRKTYCEIDTSFCPRSDKFESNLKGIQWKNAGPYLFSHVLTIVNKNGIEYSKQETCVPNCEKMLEHSFRTNNFYKLFFLQIITKFRNRLKFYFNGSLGPILVWKLFNPYPWILGKKSEKTGTELASFSEKIQLKSRKSTFGKKSIVKIIVTLPNPN